LLHERVKLDLEVRPSGGVVEAVDDSLVDLGICSGDTDTRGLHVAHYRRDALVVVMRDDHPLAGRERVAFAETLDSAHVGLHSASSINARTHLAAQQAGVSCGYASTCRASKRSSGWCRPVWASASCR
jgi:DNA-binding transcriptional LysR family regulator